MIIPKITIAEITVTGLTRNKPMSLSLKSLLSASFLDSIIVHNAVIGGTRRPKSISAKLIVGSSCTLCPTTAAAIQNTQVTANTVA
jgi:bacterioferritin-associated ferredoxin